MRWAQAPSKAQALPQGQALVSSRLLQAILRAAPALASLQLDELPVPLACLQQAAASCTRLQSLSLMGCRGMCDGGLRALAAACPALHSLAIGGRSGLWQEDTGLAALTQLRHLSLGRRSCKDAQMSGLLGSLSALASLRLADGGCLSDAGLAALAGLGQLTSLVLMCGDCVEGAWLPRLARVEVLRLRYCRDILPRHVQVRVCWGCSLRYACLHAVSCGAGLPRCWR